MPTDIDIEDDQELQGAARRVQEKDDRQMAALQTENAILKAGLTDLNPEQAIALKAVLGDDLSPETVKAKAETLGFVKPAEEPAGEPDAQAQATAAAEERISNAVSQSSPPPDPAAAPATWRDRLTQAPVSHMQVGGPLYQEVLAEIQAQPNLRMGAVDHDGTFQPT